MATLKKFNLNGEEIGTISLDEFWKEVQINSQMIKDYLIALRANARQWSASTKGRSEVKHTTKKPHRQKGTGRARQGSLVSPQFRGGGIVFGPKPKFDQRVRINKKERKAVIRAILSEKLAKENAVILESTQLDVPKTKMIVNFMKNSNLTKKVLFLVEGNYEQVETEEKKQSVSVRCKQHANFVKSLRNIPKTTFSLAKNTNGYDLINADSLVITESALQELKDWLA